MDQLINTKLQLTCFASDVFNELFFSHFLPLFSNQLLIWHPIHTRCLDQGGKIKQFFFNVKINFPVFRHFVFPIYSSEFR